ncbi:aminoglycoside N(3)-acetyltransferase [Paractinoplanes ovalisporus]|uniref:aminoglycoside N(3)-acetyltransferase n=1 Tax=Paractinoplanes ovalisporus TaxID=2810368 RepID=UPI0027DCC6E6|nr:AAC(3) family N-acetyltransferase [Actinoplanes ovalisporus]
MIGRDALVADLAGLDLPAGGTVLVHCAMRRVGWIDGGAATLLAALREVIGPAGTVVVPALTPDNSLTSPVYRAATSGMTVEQRTRYEAAMPGFDPATTASYGVGTLAEEVRRHPDARRSRHPQTSFAALGPAAADVVRIHDLRCHLGERSPLGALYRRRATILLLGVGMDKCTALHLAEYRLEPRIMRYSCFVADNGRRRREEFDAPALDDTDFEQAGKDLLTRPWAVPGRVGAAAVHVFPMVEAVDRATEWFRTNRRSSAAKVDDDRVVRAHYAGSGIAAESP